MYYAINPKNHLKYYPFIYTDVWGDGSKHEYIYVLTGNRIYSVRQNKKEMPYEGGMQEETTVVWENAGKVSCEFQKLLAEIAEENEEEAQTDTITKRQLALLQRYSDELGNSLREKETQEICCWVNTEMEELTQGEYHLLLGSSDTGDVDGGQQEILFPASGDALAEHEMRAGCTQTVAKQGADGAWEKVLFAEVLDGHAAESRHREKPMGYGAEAEQIIRDVRATISNMFATRPFRGERPKLKITPETDIDAAIIELIRTLQQSGNTFPAIQIQVNSIQPAIAESRQAKIDLMKIVADIEEEIEPEEHEMPKFKTTELADGSRAVFCHVDSSVSLLREIEIEPEYIPAVCVDGSLCFVKEHTLWKVSINGGGRKKKELSIAEAEQITESIKENIDAEQRAIRDDAALCFVGDIIE